jgi:hypothetical protein
VSRADNEDKVYMGDSVYADWDGINIVLTTENDGTASNTIYIDDQVWAHLVDYIDSLRRKAKLSDKPTESKPGEQLAERIANDFVTTELPVFTDRKVGR